MIGRRLRHQLDTFLANLARTDLQSGYLRYWFKCKDAILALGLIFTELGSHSFRKGIDPSLANNPGGPAAINISYYNVLFNTIRLRKEV